MDLKKLNKKNITSHLYIYYLVCILCLIGIYLIHPLVKAIINNEEIHSFFTNESYKTLIGLFLIILWFVFTFSFLSKPKPVKFLLKEITEKDGIYRLLFYNEDYGNAIYYTDKKYDLNTTYKVMYKKINNNIYKIVK